MATAFDYSRKMRGRRSPTAPVVPVANVPSTTTSRTAFSHEAATPRRPKLRMLADFMQNQGRKMGEEMGLGKNTLGVSVTAQDYGKGTPGQGGSPIPDTPGYGRPMRPPPINPPIPGHKPVQGFQIEASPITSPWAQSHGAETGFSRGDIAATRDVIMDMLPSAPRDPGGAPYAPPGAALPMPYDRVGVQGPGPGPAPSAFHDLQLNTQMLSPAPGISPGVGREGVGGDPRNPNAYPPGAFEAPVGVQPTTGTEGPAALPPTPEAPESAADPIQTIASTETMQTLNQDPVKVMEDEGFNIEEVYADLMKEIGAPEPEGLSKEDKSRLLMEFGFSLMAAGGQPGATFLGSVGAAGLNTMKSYRDLRAERQDTARAEREERRDVMGMAVEIESARQSRNLSREQMETQLAVARESANATIEAANIRAGASQQGQLPANAQMVEYMVGQGIVADTPGGRRQALDEIRSGKLNVGTLAARLIPGLMEQNFDATPDEIGRMAADAAFAFAQQYGNLTAPNENDGGGGGGGGERKLQIDTQTGDPVWVYPDGRTEAFTMEAPGS